MIGILLAINAWLLIVGALAVRSDAHKAGKGVRIGIVFDIGGKNDKSFNESAWRGLQGAEAAAAEALSIRFQVTGVAVAQELIALLPYVTRSPC